jgi:hypothetical protein
MSGRAYLHLVLLGAAIGIPAALVAAEIGEHVGIGAGWGWQGHTESIAHAAGAW